MFHRLRKRVARDLARTVSVRIDGTRFQSAMDRARSCFVQVHAHARLPAGRWCSLTSRSRGQSSMLGASFLFYVPDYASPARGSSISLEAAAPTLTRPPSHNRKNPVKKKTDTPTCPLRELFFNAARFD